MSRKFLLFSLLMILAGAVSASDLMREQRMADEIEEAILVGEPMRLKAGDMEFLAIYAEEDVSYSKGAAIILHGRGAHPDWMEVVQPLRSELPGYGWKTLSLQMPVASVEAAGWVYRDLIPESFPRITAAVAFLKQKGVKNIVLIGHSLGARMAVEYLASDQASREVRALVAVGLGADKGKSDSGTLGALQKLKLPALDLYGSRDLESVLATAGERAAAARKSGNGGYRQVKIDGADHFFRGLDETLVARVRGWLGGVASK